MTDYLKEYYNNYDEDGRLVRDRVGQVEFRTTWKYICDHLPVGKARILEVGAGTGRYSVALAKKGHDVTAVELIAHNLDILRAKLDGSERLTAIQGNALDLSMLEENAFDMTLVLGPMYHLYTEAEKKTALREAVRVTKPGGILMIAYCMNEATVIQYVFGANKRREVMEFGMLTPDWKCVSEPKDLFEMVRTEDIDRVNAAAGVTRLKLVATDGASRYIRDYMAEWDEETFEKWVEYHLATCERADLIGATNHALDILRKNG